MTVNGATGLVVVGGLTAMNSGASIGTGVSLGESFDARTHDSFICYLL